MGSNHQEEQSHHVVKIWEVSRDRLASMQKKISASPQLLTTAAGRSSCCIFRVPQRLIDINGKSYQPHVVSIGPYHRGKLGLRMIEEHKWRYLGSLLSRTERQGLGLEDYLKAIHPLETKARECYSEAIQLDSEDFIEMLVLDGCFIIEIFRRFSKLVPFDREDPLVSMSWVFPFFSRDFLRLENQIPFFVLECLFDLTKMPGEESTPTLASLALEFFNIALQRPDEVTQLYQDLKGKHLLDLLRSSFIHADEQEPRKANARTPIIQSISKLRRAWIKLRAREADSFLVIKFSQGEIEMPTITMDVFMTSFLLNCVALEQCQKSCSKHFTTYVTLLDCLINAARDVEYLCDRNIIENYYGTEAEVARFINNICKDVAFDIDRCYLSNLFNEVYEYYQNGWHARWESFKFTYFVTPWSFISALAALILLLLTLAQTFFTIYPYFHSPN